MREKKKFIFRNHISQLVNKNYEMSRNIYSLLRDLLTSFDTVQGENDFVRHPIQLTRNDFVPESLFFRNHISRLVSEDYEMSRNNSTTD